MRKVQPPPPFTRFKLWRKRPPMDSRPPNRRRKRPRKLPVVPQTSSSAANDDVVRDRISNLPDSILCHILSKLPTKTAIATAVLSTKWKHLFASIPNLTLLIDDNAVSKQPNPNFVNFMYHLLNVTIRHVPSIRKFELVCRHDYGNSHVDAWVSTALGLKVSALHLFFPVENTGVSIEGIFQCETLEELVLYQHLYVEVPDTVFLPNLTALALGGSVKFPDFESLEIIMSGCPVLEELSLDGCKFEQTDAFRICSPSLKFLRINNCNDDDFYEVSIHTPLLEVLIYDDIVATGYSWMNLNSLRKAYIDVGVSDFLVEVTDDEDFQRYNQNVAELVAACCNVDCLGLSAPSMAAIHWSSYAIPMFYNLTELKLGDLSELGWELLPHLLESAPNLETLVFIGGFTEDEGCFKKIESSISNPVPTCLSLHLQSIHFEDFNGEQDGMELVYYFLQTAAVLREMCLTDSVLSN